MPAWLSGDITVTWVIFQVAAKGCGICWLLRGNCVRNRAWGQISSSKIISTEEERLAPWWLLKNKQNKITQATDISWGQVQTANFTGPCPSSLLSSFTRWFIPQTNLSSSFPQLTEGLCIRKNFPFSRCNNHGNLFFFNYFVYSEHCHI